VAATASPRRIGAEDSKTRAQLLDAAERLLLDEGYAAVTSRKVAARAGLKPQLVHYYFRTMDDLFLEVFRRRADANLDRLAKAVARDGSLRSLWRLHLDLRGGAFTTEFAALANHRKAIRAEVAAYAERFRAAQIEAFTAALADAGVDPGVLPPVVAVLVTTGLSQLFALERGLGVTSGHRTAMAHAEQVIAALEAK
jgi:AcrR family transcriptional regulator